MFLRGGSRRDGGGSFLEGFVGRRRDQAEQRFFADGIARLDAKFANVAGFLGRNFHNAFLTFDFENGLFVVHLVADFDQPVDDQHTVHGQFQLRKKDIFLHRSI